MEETAGTIKISLEGEICPYTLIRTLKKVEELSSQLKEKGMRLEVIYDHPPVVENIPKELQRKGFQVKVEKIALGQWKATITK